MTPEVPPPVNLQESELPDPLPKQSPDLRQETNQNPEQETAEPLVDSRNLNSGAHTEPEVEPVEVSYHAVQNAGVIRLYGNKTIT